MDYRKFRLVKKNPQEEVDMSQLKIGDVFEVVNEEHLGTWEVTHEQYPGIDYVPTIGAREHRE